MAESLAGNLHCNDYFSDLVHEQQKPSESSLKAKIYSLFDKERQSTKSLVAESVRILPRMRLIYFHGGQESLCCNARWSYYNLGIYTLNCETPYIKNLKYVAELLGKAETGEGIAGTCRNQILHFLS
ncbi:hypothetical protein IEQ34_009472 [Dendrobium chrysotoxum]|uniref:Uncharacterized protein n=1 Tax=Dendrobium chrysotoxum TaxID=161865 RepID=A0AAV7H254_DENCH|nr:hypothetical protein IEQ34_009472 [Dendrobium chrysotoxum]